MSWQPIESAPKDGTHILLTRYDDIFGWVRGHGYWADLGSPIGGGWIGFGFVDPPGNLGLGNPTLWQHIPAPPEMPDEWRHPRPDC